MSNVIRLSDHRRARVRPALAAAIERVGGDILAAAQREGPLAAEEEASRAIGKLDEELRGPRGAGQPRNTFADVLVGCESRGGAPAFAVVTMLARLGHEPGLCAAARDVATQLEKSADLGSRIAPLAAVGRMAPQRAWRAGDVYGDEGIYLVEFAGPEDTRPDGMCVVIEWGRGRGYVKDLFAIPPDGLEPLQEELEWSTTAQGAWAEFGEVDATDALRTIAAALQQTETQADDLPLGVELRDLGPVLAARIADAGVEPAVVAPATDEDADAAVAEFFGSPQARELLVGEGAIGWAAARRWAGALARFGADDDLGRPLRIGVAKTTEFLDAIADTGHTLRPGEVRELAATLRSWTQWRTEADGLGDAAAARLLRATTELSEDLL